MLEPRQYSRRLGVLTHDQLQAALRRFDLGELKSAAPVEVGLFGQNVFLDSSRGRFVLRGCPHTPWQLEQERDFAKRIHERTRVPAPWPYRVEDSDDLFGWSYAIMPRLPGDPPQTLWPHLDRDERREVAGAMGEALGELHSFAAPGFGVWDPDPGGVRLTERPFEEWALARILEVLLEHERTPGIFAPGDADWIRAEVEAHRASLEVAPTPAIVHTDYALGNVVVVRDPAWRVSGVFDLQMACFGDPEEDLSRVVCAVAPGDLECARRFVRAYRARRALRPGYAARFRLHMLRDRLVIWHYGRANRVWFEEDATFRRFARGFVELDVFSGAG